MLYMAAVSAITHNPDLARKYRELRARGKPPKVALVAVMRKLVVLANALLAENREWTPEPMPIRRPPAGEIGRAGSALRGRVGKTPRLQTQSRVRFATGWMRTG